MAGGMRAVRFGAGEGASARERLARARSLGRPCLPAARRPRLVSSGRGLAGLRAGGEVGVRVAGEKATGDVRARAAAAASGEQSTSLDSLKLHTVITPQGEVSPSPKPGSQSHVFGIFDQAKQLQFIGFSKDLKNTLRTMLGRQPDYCYYFKHVDFDDVDQAKMVAVRDAWIKENFGTPHGNTAAQRTFWQQPTSAGGVSDRGKIVAAKQQLEQVMKKLTQRGLREEFVANEDLLAEGKVDFLPAKELTAEELEAKEAQRRAILEATRTATAVVDGKPEDFTLFFESVFQGNGGAMVDVVVTKDDVASNHRIIVGEEYVQALKIDVRDIVERSIAFLISKKVDRHTEGILNNDQFPVNYFALSTIEQWFGDFAEVFQEGDLPGENSFWRFNRIHDYGDQSSALAVK